MAATRTLTFMTFGKFTNWVADMVNIMPRSKKLIDVFSKDAIESLPENLREINFLENCFAFIKSWLNIAGVDDSWPDGAYWQMHSEATDAFLETTSNKPFPNLEFDWYDIQCAYIEWSNKSES